MPGTGAERTTDPAAPRSRGPRGHAQVRLRRLPAGPRASERARDSDGWPSAPSRPRFLRAGRRRAARCPTSSRSDRLGPEGAAPGAGRRGGASTPIPCAATTPRRRPRWSPRSTSATRTATPSAAWSRCSRSGCRRAWLLRARRPQARRSARRRAHGDPGDQGRRGRRRIRDGRPARLGGPRRDRRDEPGRLMRRTNRAGGIEGGMSNGEVLRVRAAMKPISTVLVPLARSTPRRARRRRRSISGPTSAPSRRPPSSRRRWSPSCSPTPSWRSSAATPSARSAGTSTPTWRRSQLQR